MLQTQEAAAQDAEERAQTLALPAPAAGPADSDGADPAGVHVADPEHAADVAKLGQQSGANTDEPAVAGVAEEMPGGEGAPDSKDGATGAAPETADAGAMDHDAGKAGDAEHDDDADEVDQAAAQADEFEACVEDTPIALKADAAANDAEPEGSAAADEPPAADAAVEEEAQPEADTKTGAWDSDSADAEAAAEQAADEAPQAVGKAKVSKTKIKKKRKKGRAAIAAAAALRRQTRGLAGARPRSAEPATSNADGAQADTHAAGGADSLAAEGGDGDGQDEAAGKAEADAVSGDLVAQAASGAADEDGGEEHNLAAEQEDGRAGADDTLAGAAAYLMCRPDCICFDGCLSWERARCRVAWSWPVFAALQRRCHEAEACTKWQQTGPP